MAIEAQEVLACQLATVMVWIKDLEEATKNELFDRLTPQERLAIINQKLKTLQLRRVIEERMDTLDGIYGELGEAPKCTA